MGEGARGRFEENIGFCAGCNRGADEAQGRLLAFVNFDAEVEPGWDVPLAAPRRPDVSVATGLLLAPGRLDDRGGGSRIAPNTATYGARRQPREEPRASPST